MFQLQMSVVCVNMGNRKQVLVLKAATIQSQDFVLHFNVSINLDQKQLSGYVNVIFHLPSLPP